MGSVWMAQQTEPVKRPVAVKLIKAGMDSRQVIARFEAERQALALLDHGPFVRSLLASLSAGYAESVAANQAGCLFSCPRAGQQCGIYL
jgi:hypothetical protein